MDCTKFYINGEWITPSGSKTVDVINPATEDATGVLTLGNEQDVDAAVAAAKAAFPSFAATSVKERFDLLAYINDQLIKRNDEIADLITAEMGAPVGLSRNAQAPSGPQHFSQILNVLKEFEFEETLGSTRVRKEPIGVCALITPWNWPLNQIATKVAPALAAGCTMVLKPSELAPFDAMVLAEILHEAGVPKGVFNLVHGDGMVVGNALTSHADVDMVSFTGSTRAGVQISKNAAPTIKRVALELGGKSANIILDDADLAQAIKVSVRSVMGNTGQSCNAPTRLLVPADKYDEVAAIATATAARIAVGDPTDEGTHMGPLANLNQYNRVREMIGVGIEEKAELLCGGADRPDGQDKGYFVSPTIFGRVTPDMRIAREEIFGPVLSIMTYENEDEAVALANDTEYGLSGYVWSGSVERASAVANRLRTGMVHINGASLDAAAPFGGYKASGNGREWGVYGLEEFLETKSVYGAA